MTKKKEMASSCTRGGLNWMLGKVYLFKGLSSIETDCPGKWLSHLPHVCECVPGSTQKRGYGT